jgi:hypothetical protein
MSSPLDDIHPPAAHRRAKLDATLEIELRRACAVILRDLKPSGHDLEDTRMKQDILVEQGSNGSEDDLSNLAAIVPKDVPKLPMARKGNRASLTATGIAKQRPDSRISDIEPSWPLSPTLSKDAGRSKDKRSSSMKSQTLEVAPLKTKQRVESLMMGTSPGPQSPLREEFNSNGGYLAPTQTSVVSPRRDSRPLSGYILEDFYEQPSQQNNVDTMASKSGSLHTRDTASTSRARSASTDLSSAAFTSTRGSQIGAAPLSSSGERKTFEAVEEDVPAAPVILEERRPSVRNIAPLNINKQVSAQQSRSQLRPVAAMGTNLEAQAIPIIHSRSASSINGADLMAVGRSATTTSGSRQASDGESDRIRVTQSSALKLDTNVPGVLDGTNAIVIPEQPSASVLHHATPISPVLQTSTQDEENVGTSLDQQSKIKAMKLANIKDKSDEPLANSRARMASIAGSIPSRNSSLAQTQHQQQRSSVSNYTSMDTATEISELANTERQTDSPLVADKTHQWPITAPLDQLTPPASGSGPTPLIMTPHISSQMTHQHDKTVFVKDFWRPTSPIIQRPGSRVAQYSNTPSLKSRRSETDIQAQQPTPPALPPWTAGPDTSVFNPRSESPTDPVSNMVRALPSGSRPTSPLAPNSFNRTQSMTSLSVIGPPSDNANKTLPPLPGNSVQGYFPSQVPPVPAKEAERLPASQFAIPPANNANSARTRSLTAATTSGPNTSMASVAHYPPSASTSASAFILPSATTSQTFSTPQQQQQQFTASSTSLAQQQYNTFSTAATPTQNRSQSNLGTASHSQSHSQSHQPRTHSRTNTHTPSLSRRNIPPYIPGVGHVDLSKPNSLQNSPAKKKNNRLSATQTATATNQSQDHNQNQNPITTTPGTPVSASSPAAVTKPKGMKGLFFKLGGGEMPPSKQSKGGKPVSGAGIVRNKDGSWTAPPVNHWGSYGGGGGFDEEELYESDYDELACAAPVVAFGRGW